jgi:hypothetical protein
LCPPWLCSTFATPRKFLKEKAPNCIVAERHIPEASQSISISLVFSA